MLLLVIFTAMNHHKGRVMNNWKNVKIQSVPRSKHTPSWL